MAEAYLRTATRLLNDQGYRGASVERIAGLMNRTKGAFYHHHGNKLDLISACFERTFDMLRQVFSMAQASPGAGRDRAYSAALALALFQLSPGGPLLRTSALSALPEASQRRRARRTLHRLTERMTDMLVDGMADGSVRPLDPGIAAAVINACITASASLSHWTRDVHADNVAEFFVRPLFEGMATSPAKAA
jgi:AcrR family transcriptional regulator